MSENAKSAWSGPFGARVCRATFRQSSAAAASTECPRAAAPGVPARSARASVRAGRQLCCFSRCRAHRAGVSRTSRVFAAAGFHGAYLATEAPDSPHLPADRITAELYFGHADQDATNRS